MSDTTIEYSGSELRTRNFVIHDQIHIVPQMCFILDGSLVQAKWYPVPWEPLRQGLAQAVQTYLASLNVPWDRIYIWKVRYIPVPSDDFQKAGLRICLAIHAPVDRPHITLTLPPFDALDATTIERQCHRIGVAVEWMKPPVPEHEQDANRLAFELANLLAVTNRKFRPSDVENARQSAQEAIQLHLERVRECTKP